LLNDGAILSIAYDNVHYKDKPEAWNMRMVLGVSTVLGVIGVISAFGLFYLGERVFHLDRVHIQTLMYLKLSVAGHLTIFLTRTRGPFWSIRPARVLLVAVLGTQTVATLIAVYGLFMTPLGWGWAGFVWGYALVWFLLNDRVKLLAYRIFDPVKAKSKPEAKAVAEAKHAVGPKPEAKEVEPKPEIKVETKPEAKTTSDLTPQISKRAYELYEQRGRKDGRADQDWEKAKREIQKDEAKAEPKPEAKAEPKSEAKVETPSDASPQLVKRVHKLYEELGREDVRAVEELEQAERKIPEDEPHK
jgi:H+-transporting ATPase